MLATFTVNVEYDAAAPFDFNDNIVSVREAIFRANQLPDQDTIDFDPAVFDEPMPINLTEDELTITESVTIDATIDGAGESEELLGITIVAAPNSGIFRISGDTGKDVEIVGLTLTGGDLVGDGGAIFVIFESNSTLRIVDSTFVGNTGNNGGAIAATMGANATSNATLSIVRSTFADNHAASGFGGSIYVDVSSPFGGGTVFELIDSSISDSTASEGGALYARVNSAAQSLVRIVGTAFDGNTALTGSGGGVFASLRNEATMEVADSSFTSNEAAIDGGGLQVVAVVASETSSLAVDHTTFTANMAGRSGGGIALRSTIATLSATITHSTLSGNQANLVDESNGTGGGGVFAELAGTASSLSIADSTISGSNMARDGGGVRVNLGFYGYYGVHISANGTSFTLERSRLEDNHASHRGGGLMTFNGSSGQTFIQNSVITGNDAGLMLPTDLTDDRIPNSGGGVYAYLFSDTDPIPASLTIIGTEISLNTAGQHGGGIALCTKRESTSSSISRLSVYNVTISGNKAGHTTMANDPGKGGGVYLAIYPFEDEEALDARFQNVTIVQNTADEGGGVWSFRPTLAPARNDVRLTNSIISQNRKHDDSPTNPQPNNLYGSFNVAATVFNLIGSGNTIFAHDTHASASLDSQNIFTDDPRLGPLRHHGGPMGMRTHALIAGTTPSPAIDAGSNALAIVPFSDVDPPPGSVPLTTDQRGAPFTRVYGSAVDIGAHEVGMARVVDVRLDNLAWAREAYSYAQLVAAGEQLTPVFTAGVTVIDVVFSEVVTFDDNSDPLVLLKSNSNQQTAAPVLQTFTGGDVATWTIAGGLAPDKYAILLNSSLVSGPDGMDLDGDDWDEPIGLMDVLDSVDDTGPDWTGKPAEPFVSGNGMAGGDFRFHFAYLPGDYDQNGKVETADADPAVIQDGDGDGIVVGDEHDVNLVTDAIEAGATRLVAGRFRGDYNDNEQIENVVNSWRDYQVWKDTFGSTVDRRADGNNNGIVDAADYTAWRDHLGQFSAWSVLAGSGGGGGASGPVPLVLFDDAPRVTDLTISGSSSTHAPYSFATATYNGQPVVGSGNQLRTVPVGGADTVSITFNEDVNVVGSYLQLVGMRTANRPTLAEFSYDLGTMTATWRFENWAVADHYVISLSDAVTDVEGNQLDGEWKNPRTRAIVNTMVSEFPSGDDTEGGDFNFVATLLPGDATINSHVNTADGSIVEFGYTMGLTGATFAEGDFDGDGVVTAADVAIYEATFGISLKELTLLADLNGDWSVDDADYAIMYANYTANLPNPTPADGDLDGDGDLDVYDFDVFFAQYGLELSVVG